MDRAVSRKWFGARGWNAAEASTCTIKYFNEVSVLYMFLTLDIRGINDIRLISRPIHSPSHELEDTDTNTPPTWVINAGPSGRAV